jgi:hypothetical protein
MPEEVMAFLDHPNPADQVGEVVYEIVVNTRGGYDGYCTVIGEVAEQLFMLLRLFGVPIVLAKWEPNNPPVVLGYANIA